MAPYHKKEIQFDENGQQIQSDQFNNLYVKQFPPDMTIERLREMFEPFGEVTSAIMRQDAMQRSYAFICFKESSSAQKAQE